MTREEIIDFCDMKAQLEPENEDIFEAIIEALEQEPSRDMEEIKEVINCDADAETKCKMISNVLTAKLHYFEDPFKPMVEIDLYSVIKQKYIEREVLDKIRAEISKAWYTHPQSRYEEGLKDQALKDMKILDRYKAESEET